MRGSSSLTSVFSAMSFQIVPYESAHREGIIAVVQDVHREYGFSWDEAGYHRDLYEIERTYLEPGGMFWTLRNAERIVGGVGVTLHDKAHPAHDPQGSAPIERAPELKYAELHRLYLLKECRGQGWGRRMMQLTIDYATSHGCTRMIAWSDFVLADAHALYRKAGFVQEGWRICDDPDQSREHGFWKEPL